MVALGLNVEGDVERYALGCCSCLRVATRVSMKKCRSVLLERCAVCEVQDLVKEDDVSEVSEQLQLLYNRRTARDCNRCFFFSLVSGGSCRFALGKP